MNQGVAAITGATVSELDRRAFHGELGVLAYDELADRIQCHVCGGWYQRLTCRHLRRHGLDHWSYKELFGLNVTTPLQSQRLKEVQRKLLEERVANGILTLDPPTPGPPSGTEHRAQYFRIHQTPEARQAAGLLRQRWTDEELLAELRALQAACGGTLTLYYLRKHRPATDTDLPGRNTIMARFGSWRRICELLGQPHHPRGWHQAPCGVRKWSDAAILERLRQLREQRDGTLPVSALTRAQSEASGRPPGDIPSYKTVRKRFGSWQQLLKRLDESCDTPSDSDNESPPIVAALNQPTVTRDPQTPEERALAGRRQLWTDDEMLAALRDLQAERGGIVTRNDLRLVRPGTRGVLPSDSAVVARFGSWRRVCELLGQPYRRVRRARPPGEERYWTDEGILSALHDLREEAGGVLKARDLCRQRSGQKGKPGAYPSYETVLDRFGSWTRVLALLDGRATPP